MRRALELDPGYAEAHFGLGVAFYDGGQLEDAAAAFAEATRQQPRYTDAWRNLGQTYLKLGLPQDAAAALREAIRLEPWNSDDWFRLGVAYSHEKNQAGLQQVYDRLTELDPEAATRLRQETTPQEETC